MPQFSHYMCGIYIAIAFLLCLVMSSISLQKIPPYFEPSSPPPILPIIIAQTEIGISEPCKVLAQEEIGVGPSSTCLASRLTQIRDHRSPRLASSVAKVAAIINARESEPRDGNLSESESELTELESEDSPPLPLIPKPQGEAGRPGRGGYNLQQVLGWHKMEYERVKVHMPPSSRYMLTFK